MLIFLFFYDMAKRGCWSDIKRLCTKLDWLKISGDADSNLFVKKLENEELKIKKWDGKVPTSIWEWFNF